MGCGEVEVGGWKWEVGCGWCLRRVGRAVRKECTRFREDGIVASSATKQNPG